LLEPPDDLSEAEQACWRKLAPRAVRQRTLTDAEAPGFRELCQVFVMKEQVAARIAKAKAGAATKAVDGLLRHYVKLGQRVDALFARFKLTAFGKPSDAAKEKPAKANPWANMAAK
jgi:phage terminase small subunit